jgi:hypothetical protein
MSLLRFPLCLGLLGLIFLSRSLAQDPAKGEAKPKDAGQGEVKPKEFIQEFRLLDANSEVFEAVGRKGQPDDQGWRITLPAGRGKLPPAGFLTRFSVRGDFEITYTYEILKADKPTEGYGAGVSLYAAINPKTNDAVSLSHRFKPDGKIIFLADRMKTIDGELQHPFGFHVKPAASLVGKLRLQRIGSQILYFVADGADAELEKLGEHEFGKEDVQPILVEGSSGDSEAGLDFRLLTLTIRAEEMPGLAERLAAAKSKKPAAELLRPTPAPPRKAETPLWQTVALILGVVLVVALAGLGGWRLLRRRRPAAGAARKEASPPAEAQGRICFPCPGCRQTIKVNRSQAGKKGKCTRCGKLVRVPDEDATMTAPSHSEEKKPDPVPKRG